MCQGCDKDVIRLKVYLGCEDVMEMEESHDGCHAIFVLQEMNQKNHSKKYMQFHFKF